MMLTNKDIGILEYNSYYQPYIDKTEGYPLLPGLNDSYNETIEFLQGIDENRLLYKYQPEKWTIKETVQHLIDTERVFAYRALRIAREDKTPLAGFNQDDYIVPSRANERDFNEMLQEYARVRQATIALFKSFSQDALKNMGIASNSDVSVRAIGFIIIGHERHHCQIIRERYLS